MSSRKLIVGLALVAVALFVVDESWGRGRGGGGGGMRGGGGGFGGGRVSSGGFSGGGANRGNFSRPSSNHTPSFSRPSGGSGPSLSSRPSGGFQGSGSRPSVSPGSRPQISSRPGGTPGSRPNIGSGSRPNVGSRPEIGSRPNVGSRPEIGERPNLGDRPGIADRPSTTLPGLGTGIAAGVGAGIGNNLADRRPGEGRPNRPNTPQERRDQLQNRLADRGDNRGDRFDNRDDRRDDISDRRDDRRDDWANNRQDRRHDWQDHWDNNHWYHDNWCHGHWHGGWYGGGGWWAPIWNNYPAATAFGLTLWGVNRCAYTFGYWGYTNPYYIVANSPDTVAYDYSQPLVTYQTASPESTPADTPVTADASAPASLPPGVTQKGLDTFNQARDTFYQGDYSGALKLVDQALKSMPKDAATHEFRALVLFALGKYQEAAATVYAVLAVGPGWDWTTLSSMYPSVDTYTEQLRKLEEFTKQNQDSSPAHFLLAYHYITMGHNDAAVNQLKKVIELTPDNTVAKEMLAMVGGPDAVPQPEKPADSEARKGTDSPPSTSELVGNWSATSKDAKFQMNLTEDGKFTWVYDQQGKRQEVKGVYALDGSTLAMEPDTGGTMLADISTEGKNTLRFLMVGGPPGDPGLKFIR